MSAPPARPAASPWNRWIRIAMAASMATAAAVLVAGNSLSRFLPIDAESRERQIVEKLWAVRPALLESLQKKDKQAAIQAAERWRETIQSGAGTSVSENGPLSDFEQRRMALSAEIDSFVRICQADDWNEASAAGLRCLQCQRDLAATLYVRPKTAVAPARHEEIKHFHPKYELGPDEPVPEVHLTVVADKKSGWNVFADVQNFAFRPDQASGPYETGNGHAHLYVDERKVARIYGPWHYLGELSPGSHVIRITLNSNDHQDLARNGTVIGDSVTVTVPDWKSLALVGRETSDAANASATFPKDELCIP